MNPRGTILKTVMEEHGQFKFVEIEGDLDFDSMRKQLINVRKRLNRYLPGVQDSAECERLYQTLAMHDELGKLK